MTSQFAISNIAWSPVNRRQAYSTMAAHGFSGLEIAPGLLFPNEADPFLPPPSEIKAVLCELDEFGLQLVSMQSLLFGVPNASLFGNKTEQELFLTQMGRALQLATSLNIPNVVFGSPKNRLIPSELAPETANEIATDTFRRLGDMAHTVDTIIAIEPNPVEYGANFLTDLQSASSFVREVDHPAIRLNFDIGAIAMTHQLDHLEKHFAQNIDIVSHIHVSAPKLAPAPANAEIARRITHLTGTTQYNKWLSIEMRAAKAVADEINTVESCIKTLATAGEPHK